MSTQSPSKPGGLRLLPVALATTVLAAAVLLSFALSTPPEPPAEPAPRPSAQPAPSAQTPRDEGTSTRLLALERRVMELSARPAPAPAPAPQHEPTPLLQPELDPLPPELLIDGEVVNATITGGQLAPGENGMLKFGVAARTVQELSLFAVLHKGALVAVGAVAPDDYVYEAPDSQEKHSEPSRQKASPGK
jgi:hypothetical protein